MVKCTYHSNDHSALMLGVDQFLFMNFLAVANLLSDDLFGDNTLNLACHYPDVQQGLSFCKIKSYEKYDSSGY